MRRFAYREAARKHKVARHEISGFAERDAGVPGLNWETRPF